METDYTLAIIAIVLSLIALIGLAYVYVDTPETTDLSGVEGDIISVKSDVRNLDNSVKSLSRNILDIDCECDVDISDDDLEDLEDYANDFHEIDENVEDIITLKSRVTILETTGCDCNCDELESLVSDIIICAENHNTPTPWVECVADLGN